jgi:hypothetical protein
MNIKELNAEWIKDKDKFRRKELGTGVQNFVKKVLESEDIFNLKEGKLSTKLENRKNEYIQEQNTRTRNRADFVIYINSEIIIPVEVEQYGNIEAGEIQLFTYQNDLEKQYGILTDGYKWRFYNNNIFREFTIDEIFSNVDNFIVFWNEYIKPENYYLSFFENKTKNPLFQKTKTLSVEENRQIFFEDITRLIKNFKNKLQLEGYVSGTNQKDKEKKAVELTYAYIIQFILYKTLVDNDFGNFANEFDDRVVRIYENLKENKYKEILGIIDGISAQISENIYKPFSKEQEYITQKILQIYRSLQNTISDVSPWLDIFIFIKKYNFSNIENEIFGYIYENYLKELYSDEKRGQYFTDPAIVNFMLHEIGYTSDVIKKKYAENSISLIDPSCGSGTFLYAAVNQIIKAFGNGNNEKSKLIETIVNENIFGLDIEEFPLYLAEMNILMRLLPLIINKKYNNPIDKKIKVFLTKDSVAEFFDTALRNTINDISVKSGQLSINFDELDLGYKSYVREEDDLEEMKRSLEEHPKISRRRFDYVIGNPPYVSYNECSKQSLLTFELIKKGKVQLNNIYGVNLHSIPNNPKKYAPKPNLYAFFIALGLALLKDNGKLCYIIPQNILTASDLDVIRYHLSKNTTIEKIVIFNSKMFINRGVKQNKIIPTSSLIFVVSKNKLPPMSNHEVEIINYKNENHSIDKTLENILHGKYIDKKKISQNILLKNVKNWNFVKQNKKFLSFYESYQKNTVDISIYYDHVTAKQFFGNKFYFDGSFNIPTKDIQTKKIDDNDYWEIPHLKSDGFRVKTEGFYPKNRKIKIAHGSQGMIMLNTEYKVIWRYVNPDKFFFIEGKNVLPRFQQFCIASNEKGEILYLLSLLNSRINLLLLKNLLKNEQEKDILIGLSIIKNFVRIPKINDRNKSIKNEIIQSTEEMLELEEKKLSDFIDFSNIMIQKFDEIKLEKDKLILIKDKNKFSLDIKGNNIQKELIKKIINEKFINENVDNITLLDLKDLPIIDYDLQKQLKDYIDDLVFALYFNVTIDKLGLDEAQNIKDKCKKNQFYDIL